MNLFYKQTEIQLDDEYIKIISSQEPINTYEFDNSREYDEIVDPDEPVLTNMYIRQGRTKKLYFRSVGSMLEFLGDLGGLIEITFLCVSGCIFFITERNFKAAMISDTYKVQKYSRDQSEFYQSKADINPDKH